MQYQTKLLDTIRMSQESMLLLLPIKNVLHAALIGWKKKFMFLKLYDIALQWYLDTCPKSDVISFSWKGFYAVGLDSSHGC